MNDIQLYKGITEEEYIELVGEKTKSLLEWALTIKPGDLINDCSMFNVDVIEIEFIETEYNGATYITNCDFTTSVGICSLIYCGVEPKKSREQVEREYLEFLNYSIEKNSEWFDLKEMKKTRERLLSGKHITDKEGRRVF